ncbi:MAG TPA: M14 family zinc carboxypeptidase [Phycisphaerales bacterium]|nr:M14 family zinc carboxypeptidase [Phycisphaerales bacterium]
MRRWALLPAHAALGAACLGQPLAQGPAARYDGYKLVRVRIQSVADVRTMQALGADQWSHRLREGVPGDFMIAPDMLDDLDATGLRYEVAVEDVQAQIDAENARLRRGPGARGWFDDFKPLAEIHAYLDTLAAARPDLASTFEVGQSLEGRPVRGIRIANDAFGDPACKPTILINACQHAREWIAPMVAMYGADRLLGEYGADGAVTELIDRAEILIVPVVNVDGYEFTWTNQRLWRKNRRNNGDGTFGVDLNRNWGYEWGHDNGSSGSTRSETYRGAAPFSEPETQILRDLARSLPRLAAQVDLHSYGQLILAPWGYTIELPPDHETFQTLAARMQQEILGVHERLYSHGPTYTELYPISGGEGDWFWGDRGVHNFLIELRGSGFVLPPEQIIPNAEEVYPALLAFAAWSRDQRAPLGDFNDDAAVDTRDVVEFLNAWSSGHASADFNLDGTLDIRDVIAFLNGWAAGCA